MIVRELVTKLGFQVDNAKLKGYERGINNIKTQADSAANAFRGMFAAFVGFQGLKSLANTADEMQNLESRIGMLPQTVGSAGEAFDEVAKHAINARQPLLEYGKLYTRIGNATKKYVDNQKDVLEITDTISKGLIVGGASAQESASVMMQLSQALGSGVLQGQEFNAMAEGAPDLLDKLSVAMGYPREQLKKLGSEGKITTKQLVLALKKIAPEVSKQFDDMPTTIGQALTTAYSRFQVFIARLNRESNAVSTIAENLLKFFDGILVGLMKLVDFFGGATQAVKFFGIALAAIALPFALQAIVGLMAFLLSPIAFVVGGLILIGLAIEDIYQWATGGKSIMGALFGDFDYFMFRINGIIEYVKGLFEVLFGILTFDMDMISKGFKRMFNGLVESLFSLTLAITQAFENGFANVDFASFFKKMGDKLYYALSEALAKFFAWNLDLIGVKLPSSVGASKVASSGGSGNVSNSNVTINQTLPSGTPAETKQAAFDGAKKAIYEKIMMDRVARQAGQAQ